MILCDIGNTTFHFLINNKHYKYFLDEELPKLEGKIYFISVNDKAKEKFESTYEEALNLEDFIDFTTSYVGMGLDRKVACFSYENAIIVDAGSAITVDVMANAVHQGGLILPGIKKLKELYANTSSKLDVEINTKVNLDTIPQCTQDAVSYSILKSIILPIKELCHKEQVLFTGGDGEFLSRFFENAVYKNDLIFENMKGIIDANNCIAKG